MTRAIAAIDDERAHTPVVAVRQLINRRLELLQELTELPVVFGGAIDRSQRSDHLAPRSAAPLLPNSQALAEIEATASRLSDPSLRARLVHAHRSLTANVAAPATPATAVRLAPREEQCLALAATGATNTQIAGELGLSTETVKA